MPPRSSPSAPGRATSWTSRPSAPPFLDTTGGDPRRPFAESLVDAVGTSGMILVYNAAFERGVIMQRRLVEFLGGGNSRAAIAETVTATCLGE